MGLIVIEGLDGAGKTTQIERLHDYLTAKGHNCRRVHFPRTDDNSAVYGETIARFLRGEFGAIEQVNPYLVALIYAGDRLDFKPTLEKWLSNGDTVLLDRYVYSNVAYQCAKLTDPKDKSELCDKIQYLEFEYGRLPKPDITIFLDAPLQFTCRKLTDNREGADRQYLKGKQDIHEANIEFQNEVRKMYLSLSNNDGFVRIDCSDGQNILSVDQIFNSIVNVLKDTLI